MRSKELSRIVSRNRSGEGYQNITAALKVPKNTVVTALKVPKHTTACLEYAKRQLKASQTLRNKILCSDKTKIELFGLNAKRLNWRTPGTIPTVKHGGGSIVLRRGVSVAGTGRLVRIEEKMNGAKYRAIIDENLFQKLRITFHGDNNSNHIAQSLRGSAEKNGRNPPHTGVPSL
jgi:hypothetical protein